MLIIGNVNYASDMTVLFQRLSVIATDSVYLYGVHRVSEALPTGWEKDVLLPILLLTNCGLIMVDHIHFQYNGVMYGIMLLSIALMLKERYKWSAFWYTFLLNMKHIYMYLAPAYFIYLLRHYCIGEPLTLGTILSKRVLRSVLQLSFIVTGVFAVSLLPFWRHISQVLLRLFPFKRGLCHAYWAPNIWALYNTVDKVSSILAPKFNISIQINSAASMTGGLIQEFPHIILPNVSPLVTMLLSMIFMIPLMLKLFCMNKEPINFLRGIVLCGLTSFLYGWHVHEKAILMAIVPLSLLSIMEPADSRIFLLLSTVGHYSLLPLLFTPQLLFVKLILLILYTSYIFYSLHKFYLFSPYKYALPLLNIFESIYIIGLLGVLLYEQVVHKMLKLETELPFLPLMFTSDYCALGILYCWASYYLYFLKQ